MILILIRMWLLIWMLILEHSYVYVKPLGMSVEPSNVGTEHLGVGVESLGVGVEHLDVSVSVGGWVEVHRPEQFEALNR